MGIIMLAKRDVLMLDCGKVASSQAKEDSLLYRSYHRDDHVILEGEEHLLLWKKILFCRNVCLFIKIKVCWIFYGLKPHFILLDRSDEFSLFAKKEQELLKIT